MKGTPAEALVVTEDRAVSLGQVYLPEVKATDIKIRTLLSGVSIGTEMSLIHSRISWGPFPLVTGYQGVGVVEETGSEVEGFSVDDVVYYRHNGPMELAKGGDVTPASGTHCSHVVLDSNNNRGVDHLPDGVNPAAGCLFVMPAVGLHGATMAGVTHRDRVAVVGCGLIGLGVVAACAGAGAEVIAFDLDKERLALAGEFGATQAVRVGADSIGEDLAPFARWATATFEATGLPDLIEPALELPEPYGRFVWQGNYGDRTVGFSFLPVHMRQLRMIFPCNDGLAPTRRAVLRQMANGTLPWERVITHTVTPTEAVDLYRELINATAPGVLGAVIDWRNGT